jgi:sulfate permease, SulP family
VPAGLGAGQVLAQTVLRFDATNVGAFAVGAVALVTAGALRYLAPRWPFMLVGLAVASVVAVALQAQGLIRVHSLGALPSVWPPLHLPQIELHELVPLFDKALALSVIALGQSLAIAKALAARSGQRIDANREFLGQGLSNIVGGCFSCYLSCGSLNRSLPNLEAGARTPLASVFSALWLIALVALTAPWLARIPMPAIAGLLVLVAWSLVDLASWKRLAQFDHAGLAIAAATLVAALTLRLESAILLGTALSLVAYLYRSSRPAMRSMGFDSTQTERRFVVLADRPGALPECPQLKLLRMEGSIYFGAAAHVEEQLHALRAGPALQKHLLVMAKSMNFIDLAGADLWAAEMRARRAIGGDLYFHRPRPQVVELWERTRFIETLGRDHLFPDKRSAIGAIFGRLDPAVCADCAVRLFWECQALPLRGVQDAGSGI